MRQPYAPPPGNPGSPPPAVDRGSRTIRTAVKSENAATIYAAVYSAMIVADWHGTTADQAKNMLALIGNVAAVAVHRFALLLDEEVACAEPDETR